MAQILIVEDEVDLRETMREVIEDEGYTVAEATNGQEALDYLTNNPPPCLVLLDLMMPVMSGFDFLKTIKQDERFRGISVLVVSAAAKERIHEATTDSAAVGFLTKPVQLRTLLTTIEQFC